MKATWLTFANEYLIDNDHIRAYQVAFPKITDRKVAATRGLALLRKPQIASYIRDETERKKIIVEAAREKEIINAARKRIISETEVDAILCDIISGAHEVERVIIIRGKPVRIKVKPEMQEKIQAINTYYKRFGSFAPEKSNTPPDPLALKSNDELMEMLEETLKLLRDDK